MNTYEWPLASTCVYTHMHVHTCILSHTHKHMNTHIDIYTYIHTHFHIYTLTYTCIIHTRFSRYTKGMKLKGGMFGENVGSRYDHLLLCVFKILKKKKKNPRNIWSRKSGKTSWNCEGRVNVAADTPLWRNRRKTWRLKLDEQQGQEKKIYGQTRRGSAHCR